MNYRKSAFPYLVLLAVLVIGAPLVNYTLEKKQQIKIEIESNSVDKQSVPIASIL